MDLMAEYDKIIRLATEAKAALADEHEGDHRNAVFELEDTIAPIADLVRDW